MSTESLGIHLLSGPRNISTALMYSFAQRTDTQVVDEPLYAHYLSVTGVEHPGHEEVLASLDQDGARVVRQMLTTDWEKPVVFFKHIAKHVIALPIDFLLEGRVLFLIREPDQMLSSLINQLPEPNLQETALKEQWELARWLGSQGRSPLVVDSKQILLEPETTLTRLCEALGIAFEPAMLSWEAGPRPEDGVWAPHWYHNVHQSTGFGTYKRKEVQLPDHLQPLLAECNAYYQKLSELTI